MDDARAQRSRCAAQSILDGARRLCVAVVLILAFVPEVLLQRGAHAPDMVVIRGDAHIQKDRVALLAVQLVIVSQVLSAMLMTDLDPFARVLKPPLAITPN